jgi:DNA-binding NarL/FixJ family response regulator
MQANSIPVLIVEESPLVSLGLRHLLEDVESGFSVRCVAPSEATAEFVARTAVAVVILDANTPGEGHHTLARALKAGRPDLCIVVVTSSRDAVALGPLVLAGVDAILDVGVTPKALVEVLRLLRQRVRFVTTYELWPAILTNLTAYAHADEGRTAVLTPREREVYVLLRDGRTDREIAEALTISLWTVKHHVGSILQKLSLTSRREVLRA